MGIFYFTKNSGQHPWLPPLLCGAVVVLVYIGFLAILLPRAGGHPWGLIGFSRNLTIAGQDQVPEQYVSTQYGYDGQAYFVLALSPFIKNPSELGFRFDNQILRQQRILYPFLVHALAKGDSERTAWMMFIVNIAAVGILVVLSAQILSQMQQPFGLSLLAGFYPGFAVSVSRALTEPLCLVWVLSAIRIWRRHPFLAGAMLGLGVVTRETAILVAAGFGCAWLVGIIKKDPTRPAIWLWVFPLLTYILWHGYLIFYVADSSLGSAASSNIGWPLAGFIGALWKNLTEPDILHLYFLSFMGITVAWQFFVVKKARKQRNPIFYGWIFCGVLIVLAGLDIWDNSPGLLRIATEWNILGLLLVAGSGFARWKPVAAVWVGVWLLAAGGEWYRYGLIF
jgi:hypothetical protein